MSCSARARSHRAVLSERLGLPTPKFCASLRIRRRRRFLRTPRRWFLRGTGGLQPGFLNRPSIPPLFAENGLMLPGKSSPAGIPHPAPSPPGNYGRRKLGVARETFVDYIRRRPYNKLMDEGFFPIRGLTFRRGCLSSRMAWEEKWEMSRKKN